MFRKATRRWLKHAMWLARVKIIYSRITLTKWTTMFFFQSIISCLVLAIVQSLSLKDTYIATDLISELLQHGNVTRSLIIFDERGKVFKSCNDIPGSPTARCTALQPNPSNSVVISRNLSRTLPSGHYYVHQTSQLDRSSMKIAPSISGATIVDAQGATVLLDETCLKSLLWLDHTLRNSKREDTVTIVYDVWLMTVSIVAILNESLLHLIAALGAHILGTAWVGSTVSGSRQLEGHYRSSIVGKTCPVDVLGNWWQLKHNVTYICVALNATATVASFLLALKLYQVYSKDTFSRVGSSPIVHKAYKLVLLLSVLLQLSGFFLIAWAGVLIDKVINGLLADQVSHPAEYIVFSVVISILIIPWLLLGWTSVRKEQRIQFFLFLSVAVVIIAISSCMYFSAVYRFLFIQWKFFATLTVTSFVLVIFTGIVGICCYLSFGRGLTKYLQAKETPEGTDFAPVIHHRGDVEKGRDYDNPVTTPITEKTLQTIQQPRLAYLSSPRPTVPSVYSDPTRHTIKLSTTPPIAQDDSPFSAISGSNSDESWVFSRTQPSLGATGRGLPSNPLAISAGKYF